MIRINLNLGEVQLDEFQEVAELPTDFPLEKIFRSCLQAHKHVRYVFLGSKTHLLKRMFSDATRPFYNSALPMLLRKPPESESIEFLISRFGDNALHTALNELIDAAIVEKGPQSIHLADPFFVRYIRKPFSCIFR